MCVCVRARARACVCVRVRVLQMYLDHIMKLNGKLEAPSGGKDLILNLMQDLESFLPKGTSFRNVRKCKQR